MLPIFPRFSTPLPPPHISSHLATKNIECEEKKKIAELESFLKILNQMPGLCPYFLHFLQDLPGPSRGTPAPGTVWEGGGGGGGHTRSELLPPAAPKALRERVVMEQPLIKELPACFFNFIYFLWDINKCFSCSPHHCAYLDILPLRSGKMGPWRWNKALGGQGCVLTRGGPLGRLQIRQFWIQQPRVCNQATRGFRRG